MPHADVPGRDYDAAFIKLVQAALAKKRGGQKLKRDEQRAIERYQRDEDERARAKAYAAIPKKLWVEWSGRHHRVLLDQASTHGLPVSGETIDLAAVVKWIHDFLADNTHKLRKEEASEGDGTEAGERVRNLKLKNEKLVEELAEIRRETLSRAEVRDRLGMIAARLRVAGERLEREHGEAAYFILIEAIEDLETQHQATAEEQPPDESCG
jgi:hypothetical protein